MAHTKSTPDYEFGSVPTFSEGMGPAMACVCLLRLPKAALDVAENDLTTSPSPKTHRLVWPLRPAIYAVSERLVCTLV